MKIAIDVVLLPPEEIIDKAIEINKELIKQNDRVILNKENCIPHISLCMGVIEEEALPEIQKILQNVSEQFSSVEIEIEKLRIYTSPFDGLKASSFQIKKEEKLQAFHEEIVRKLEHFFSTCFPPNRI